MSSVRLLSMSVDLSVMLVDQNHRGRKSWKLIARTISQTHSLFVAQRPSTYSQGNMGYVMGKFWGDYWSTKAAISETRKDRGKITMEGL